MSFSVCDGVEVEDVDSTLLVLVPGRDGLLRLDGPMAEAFRLAQQGTHDIPDDLVEAMAGLVELGAVTTRAWSRRQVLGFGGAAAAAAVAVVALPSVAAAGSSPATTVAPSTSTTSTTLPAQGPLDLWIANSPITGQGVVSH